MASWSTSFREAFCKHYGCASEEFVRRATRKALPWRVRLLRPLIVLLHPDHFRMDFEFLERVGNARNWSEVHAAMGAFESNNRLRGGFYRNQLKFRASGRRVSAMVARVVGEEGDGPAA
jgi:hypothetical protein